MPTEEEIVKCYGVRQNCPEEDCPWRGPCLDHAREEAEEQRRQNYEQAEYTEAMDEGGTHTLADFKRRPGEDDAQFHSVMRMIDELSFAETDRDALKRLCRARIEEKDSEERILDLLRRMGELYVHDPVGFEVMFFQILAGGSQAALARERDCSRQNINKMVTRGKRRYQRYLNAVHFRPGARLSMVELAVYRAIELERMSYRQAAAVCGCSLWKIQNTIHSLRQKGFKTIQRKRGRIKQNKKQNAAG